MDTFIDKIAQKRNAQGMILANMAAEAAKMEQMQDQMKAYDELMQEIRRVNLKTAENLSEVQDTLNGYMDKLEGMQGDYGRNDDTKQALEQFKEYLENSSRNDDTKQALEQFKEYLENSSRNDDTKQALEQFKEYLEDSSRNDDTKQALEQFKEYLENNSGNDEIMQALTRLQEIQEDKFGQANDFLHKENVKVYRNVQAAVAEELGKQTEALKLSQKENRGSKALLPISILILLAVLADIAVHLFSITIPL